MSIFLSYSRGDAQQADDWVANLEKFGYRVWIDRAGIRGGQQWNATIVRSIKEAQALILLLSPNSARSDNVRREIDLAVEAKKPIIPIEIQVTAMPENLQYQLAGVQLLQVWRSPRGGLPWFWLRSSKQVWNGVTLASWRELPVGRARARPTSTWPSSAIWGS